MYKVKVKFPDSSALLKGPQAVESVLEKETVPAVDEALIENQNEIRGLAPHGVMGWLKANINTSRRVLKDQVRGKVDTGDASYAIVVNDGRRAAWAPIAPLIEWVRLSSAGKNLWRTLRGTNSRITARQVAFLVSRSMSRKAREGTKFFDKGIVAAKPRVDDIMKRAGIRILKKL